MHEALAAGDGRRPLDQLKEIRIEEAAGMAATRGKPALGDFIKLFYARGAAEDLSGYAPAELVAFAEGSLANLAERTVGRHRILIHDPDHPAAGDAHAVVTVVEILNDDMPFLVDSVMHALAERGVDVRLILHPVFTVVRDEAGRLVRFADADDDRARRESLIHLHLARLPDAEARDDLAADLDQVLADVRAAVTDWPAMRAEVAGLIEAFRTTPPPLPAEAVAEALEFLTWLMEDNFTFLGVRSYDVSLEQDGDERIAFRPESGLGLLKDPEVRILRRGHEMVQVTPEIREFMMRPEPLIVAKANVRSRVHRRTYMDYIGVKRYDAAGRLVGEVRLVGLFTSSAYTRSVKVIPYLRQKVERVIARAGLDPEGHSGKTLLNVLESYPRDDLFQIDVDTLYDFANAVLELDERPRIRVLAWRDKFDRFVSILVYVPRDRFSTDVRLRIGDYLKTVYDGRVSAFYPHFPEGSLTRIHFIIGRYEGETPNPSQASMEAAVAAIVRTWADGFQETARARLPAERARAVVRRWIPVFPPAYRDSYTPDEALDDAALIDRLSESRVTAIAFRPLGGTDGSVALKLHHRGGSVPLSERVPILEAMGFRVIEEHSFDLDLSGEAVTIHDMRITRADGGPLDLSTAGDRLHALFMAVWLGRAESDRLNALALSAGFAWREIALLRGLSRYLQQAGIAYDQGYIAETLNRNPQVARRLLGFFQARFDPGRDGDRTLDEARALTDVETALEAVVSLDDDVILRRFLNLIRAATRTSFYQLGPDGLPRPAIAFKFDPSQIDGLPEPRPFAEIWVASPRVEGVHLRFGKVARGGLRWSDRPQDFRTEVLGLVKAQQVKNAVIVPVGAKGGFFPKRLPAGGSREAVFQEGTEAYKLFVGTLLDLTDTLDGATVVPPPDTVRHDGDDPYLVVAADKGTASFSDTANALSDARGFWLSDAFASGGSAGYDHKKMGITARGAWEAVKRHFREMDVDIQTTPFTVVGVGDMSGDVFGNGMLLSRQIRLVAAFDHRDIVIDPDPDPETSFLERERLFALPRSSWQDYDTAKLSKGGGVFSRQAKAITLTPEAQAAIGLSKARATPQEVMAAILKAPVDLLWFGGIGTYVRAADESDAEVGDRANDAIRVVASDVRAKVIGEGANLGVTQKARIAYGLKGGRCNSDAVDNSAGVNSSDVEVNIKIALGRAVRDDRLTIPDRNALLSRMTPEVARLVLANNYRQTLCVSLAERRGFADFAYQRRLMQALEARGRLDRAVETLPDDAGLARRQKAEQPLTRSEIGVLMAYAKIVLYDDILESAVPDDPVREVDLLDYFPVEMRDAFAEDIRAHRLRREIIATVLANAIVNRGGPTYPIRLADQTGAAMGDIARSFVLTRAVFGLDALDDAIDALDTRIGGALQLELYTRVQDVLTAASLWFIRNKAVGEAADLFQEGVARYAAWLGAEGTAEAERFRGAGVPEALASRLALLPALVEALDVIAVARSGGESVEKAARAAATVAGAFRIGTIDGLARGLQPSDYYEGLALDRARRTLAEAHRSIAAALHGAGTAEEALAAWLAPRREAADRTVATIEQLLSGEATVARFTVAAGLLQDLART